MTFEQAIMVTERLQHFFDGNAVSPSNYFLFMNPDESMR